MTPLSLGISIVVGLLVIIALGYVISIYNGFIRLKNNIVKAWGNIDLLLKQRNDELTKLVDVVKGYKGYEQKVLTGLTEARTAFLNAQTIGQKAKADSLMEDALKSVFAVAENYPDLKANASFLHLQQRVSEIENQITDRREFYNDSVNTFNIRIEQIPYTFIAGSLGYAKKELFIVTATDRNDVKISL